MDTRMRILLLLDYTEYYGEAKSIDDAKELIKDIPSESLVNYISGINVNLYLKENDEESQKLQMYIAKNILHRIGTAAEDKYVKVSQKQLDAGHVPIIFWNYTNLQFYNLIYENFNHLPCRELTVPELQIFFDVYLILNDIANKRISIGEEEIKASIENNSIGNIVMTNFIYQKDYASTIDYANQVTRGVLFFRYLENDLEFGPHMKQFYKEKNVSGHLEIFRNLMALFVEIGIGKEFHKQLADFNNNVTVGFANPKYLETLCINDSIHTYKADQSFTTIRNTFLHKLDNYRYYILDVNFMIDHFYKAQVFAVNNFLRKEKITTEFLSIKGKDFSDAIYFPTVMKTCFPSYTKFFGDDCKISKSEELCDGYIREGKKVILIEFKDVLLNAKIKNGTDEAALFSEFRLKFVENQKGSPKGMTQLKAAILKIEKDGVNFDTDLPEDDLVIYPLIVYTDLSFGTEGLNKMYRSDFKGLFREINLKKMSIQDLTFINLNFFEFNQDYLGTGITNIFTYLDNYEEHVKNENFENVPFEVFSRSYNNEYYHKELGQPKSYLKLQKEIIEGAQGGRKA